MPITINGSGTVTGISAGGLPDDCIVTADIADNNVTTAKIANIGVTEIKIADNNVTTSKIADANITPAKLAQPLTLETAKSATSTSVDFTSIPSWVKRVTVMLDGVSQSGTSLGIIQLGDAGGVETSGYLGFASFVSTVASTNSFTSGFGYMTVGVAAEAFSGMLILALEDVSSNTWVMSGTVARSAGGNGVSLASGSKSLSATLDRIRITTVNGTDTFDAGTINIMYE